MPALPGRLPAEPIDGVRVLTNTSTGRTGALIAEHWESEGTRLEISASIGVHTIAPDASDDIDDALDTADKALYAAKANGRDCVRTSITAA